MEKKIKEGENRSIFSPKFHARGAMARHGACRIVITSVLRLGKCKGVLFPSKKVYDELINREQSKKRGHIPQECEGGDRKSTKANKKYAWVKVKFGTQKVSLTIASIKMRPLRQMRRQRKTLKLLKAAHGNQDVLEMMALHDKCMKRMKDSQKKIFWLRKVSRSANIIAKGRTAMQVFLMHFTHWCIASGKAVNSNIADNKLDCKAEISRYNNYHGPTSFNTGAVKAFGTGARKYENIK